MGIDSNPQAARDKHFFDSTWARLKVFVWIFGVDSALDRRAEWLDIRL
jgi:hypothetical protein